MDFSAVSKYKTVRFPNLIEGLHLGVYVLHADLHTNTDTDIISQESLTYRNTLAWNLMNFQATSIIQSLQPYVLMLPPYWKKKSSQFSFEIATQIASFSLLNWNRYCLLLQRWEQQGWEKLRKLSVHNQRSQVSNPGRSDTKLYILPLKRI